MKKILQEKYLLCLISTVMIVVCILTAAAFLHSFKFHEIYGLDELMYTSAGEPVGRMDNGEAGIFSYGPYVNLNKGNYKVTVMYQTDTDASFDIAYKDEKGALIVLTTGSLDRDRESVSEAFYLEKSVFDQTFEVRTYYPGQGTFQLKEIRIKRDFVFCPYMWISLAAALCSNMIFCRREILTVFKDSKAALYWGGFYTMLFCIGIHTMAYSQGQSEVVAYILADLLIILHAFGGRRKIYQEYFGRQTLVNALCYAYLVFSFFVLDLLMRNLVSVGGDVRYDAHLLNVFSFSIIGVVVFLISLVPWTRARAVLYGVVYYCFVLLLAVHTVYFQVFGKLFGLQDLLLAREGSGYLGYILGFFDIKFILQLVGLVAAGAAGIFVVQKTVTVRREWSLWIGTAVLSVVFYSHTFFPEEYGEWNSFSNDSYIYATMNDRQRAFELCGFYQYEMKDLKKFLFGHRKADKVQRQELENFFDRKEAEDGQAQNAMTGIFQGKNVIFVLMESIDDIACNDDVMPNLSRMARERIHFTNMYAPIYGTAATINTELATNVGLYAPVDGSLVYSFADNHFPYSLAARFTEHGYTAKQYHYNVAEFYDRSLLNKAFGYEEYVSFLDYAEEECTIDTVLVENDAIYRKLTENSPFFDYVISYSAHLGYDDAGENVAYAVEKYPQYSGMAGSDEIDHYFAKARITDDMLGGLMQRLETDGLLEDTVIVAVGDHFPYGIADRDTLFKLSGVDQYEQLLYRVPCVIWTPGMEPVTVEKVAGTNDIVPTLVSLMGFGDCSMYVGRNVFDRDYAGCVYCADGSWISGDSYYHDGRLVYGTMGQEEIDEMNRTVMEKITVNDRILQTDYYADWEKRDDY